MNGSNESMNENSTAQQEETIDIERKERQEIVDTTSNDDDIVVESTVEHQPNIVAEKKPMITEIELTPEEQIDKQKAEKVFRKQEEEWLNKREKVR